MVGDVDARHAEFVATGVPISLEPDVLRRPAQVGCNAKDRWARLRFVYAA